MRLIAAFVGAFAGSLLCQDCSAQAAQERLAQAAPERASPREAPKFQITDLILAKALAYVRATKGVYTDAVDCDAVADVCNRVKIYIVQPKDQDGTYCVGLIPESVKFGKASGVPKTIVWEIVPPDLSIRVPPNSTFEFYDDKFFVDKLNAIVLLSDSTPAQLKGRKIGNGNSGNKDPRYYNLKNDHKHKLDAAYLPIIVQRVPPAAGSSDPEKIALCGTPDPRILND